MRPLHPLLRPLPAGGAGAESGGGHDVAGGTLFLGDGLESSAAMVARTGLGTRRLWHNAAGAPRIDGARTACTPSLAAAGGTRALLIGEGAIGIDIETLPRIAANLTPRDAWLSCTEGRLLDHLAPHAQTLELACRWVLREAYGKALGRGLDLPLERLAFSRHAARIVLPPVAGWRFALYRRGDLVLGVASGRQAVGARGQEAAGSTR